MGKEGGAAVLPGANVIEGWRGGPIGAAGLQGARECEDKEPHLHPRRAGASRSLHRDARGHRGPGAELKCSRVSVPDTWHAALAGRCSATAPGRPGPQRRRCGRWHPELPGAPIGTRD